MREMRNENEQRRQQRNFLRCRIIPTTKNIYGRRFLCSRLESGICALPLRRLFFGETTTAAAARAPLLLSAVAAAAVSCLSVGE